MSAPPEKLHINAPELLTRRQRLGDALVTGAMWAIYTYLWAPLLSLIAWLLGFEFAYDVMVRSGGLEALKTVMLWYSLMLVGIVVVVTGWSVINRLRFSKRDRRRAGEVVGDEAIARAFDLKLSQLDKLRGAQTLRVSLDQEGKITAVAPEDAG